jgi:hypothetical protein
MRFDHVLFLVILLLVELLPPLPQVCSPVSFLSRRKLHTSPPHRTLEVPHAVISRACRVQGTPHLPGFQKHQKIDTDVEISSFETVARKAAEKAKVEWNGFCTYDQELVKPRKVSL